jgi:hypothetical protein
MDSTFDVRMALQHDIYGELCSCGHMREEHTDVGAGGHGLCCVVDCECSKYTWRRFMRKEDRMNYLAQQAELNNLKDRDY